MTLNHSDRSSAWRVFVELLVEALEDQGIESEDVTAEISSDELGLSSMDAMHVVVALEDHFGWQLDFQQMLDQDGDYPRNITMGRLFDFAWAMGTGAPLPTAGSVR